VERLLAGGLPSLALELGGQVGVALRLEAGGVAVELAAPAGLSGAARQALPALVAAVARRGVAVARASVRQRAPARR
jgi:hypothetical protein